MCDGKPSNNIIRNGVTEELGWNKMEKITVGEIWNFFSCFIGFAVVLIN